MSKSKGGLPSPSGGAKKVNWRASNMKPRPRGLMTGTGQPKSKLGSG